MASTSHPVDQARSKAQNNDAARSARAGDAPTWMTVMAKVGYAARGIIYLIIGGLALVQAFGSGGSTTDSKGALQSLLGSTPGLILLWAIAVGLVFYAAWRFIQAALDADDHGTDGKGLAVRAGLMVSAVTHALLAFYAGSLAWGQASSSDGGGGKEALVGRIMGWPAGRWIVAFIGLCIIGAGIAHAIKAHKEKYEEHFVIERSKMEKIEPICKFGLYCRSVVFAIIGGMFLYAAFTQNPENAGGLAEVLNKASQQPFGTALLAIMAAGLFCFGCYSIFEAIYRKIDGPSD
jgi:hypothetical protein